MTVVNYLKNMPAWARWALYAVVGVAVLNIVQGFDDTSLLTAEGTTRAMLRWGVPSCWPGLGGLFAERAGVVNIGLEGMMVLGTWFGAGGAAVRCVVGTVLRRTRRRNGRAAARRRHRAVRCRPRDLRRGHQHPRPRRRPIPLVGDLQQEVQESGRIDHAVAASSDGRTIHLPFLAGGDLFGWKTPDILGWFEKKDWFFVSDITGIARGLTSNMSWVTVFAFAMVPFSAWLLWRTRFGLRLRISGERPEAGEAQGVNIYFYKYVGVIVSGALAGLAGAFIASQELSGVYKEGQTTGRGFIGMAALIFGNWRPAGIFGGAMLFGYPFALKLQDLDGKASHSLLLVTAIAMFAVMVWAMLRKNTSDTALAAVFGGAALAWYLLADTPPDWWAAILPYVIVVVVLIFFTKRLRPPAADGQVYRKGEA